jgi:asparagine synthase (glutamine-hydrolysing)
MCGIAGFLRIGGAGPDAARTLTAMTDAIANRGPDDSGAWLDSDSGAALGQRRLAIIDLSPAGHQPMSSHSQRYVVTYNGEIYNYRALREQLEAEDPTLRWRGHSDTEVMLACFDRWGVIEGLKRLNGMFAMAVWDRAERALILTRDRMGEKPLYYGLMGRSVLFGSELKALQAHPDFSAAVDREAVALFLRYSYVPAPRSIWEGVAKVPAAHYVRIEADGRIGAPVAYWDFAAVASAAAAAPREDSPALVDETEALLKDAVGLRMEADVPLGAFLSGGVDSSLVVSLMQAQSSKPVRTFTIGFHDRDFNEAEHAKAVAKHLGCEHTELYVSAADTLAVVPDLPTMWDEPFADSSQIPTFLVSRMAREAVTVSLSGDGGDELFGGYTRYVSAMTLWNRASRLPTPLRKLVAAGLMEPAVVRSISAAAGLIPSRYRPMALGERIPKVGQLMNESGPDAVYRRLVSQVSDPERFMAGAHATSAVDLDAPGFADFRQKMMYVDTVTYLPDDILVKVDRASMAVSLEGRAPFLDHRVVEAAWQLPMSAKIRNGSGKAILRDILYRYVPRELIERPKMGFAIPISEWLAGPLRDWAEELLDATRLKREGFLDADAVRELWEAHCAGRIQAHKPLWNILMFQAWWDAQQRAANHTTAYSGELRRA